MSESADYTIKGFLYQFNKTLIELFKSVPDAEICVEGIIEDIDINDDSEITAIQCKYHETETEFTLSLVYKPILLMMRHYYCNPGQNIKYVLFLHVRNTEKTPIIQEVDLRSIIASQDKKLKKYIENIPEHFDYSSFLRVFRIELGASFIQLESIVFARMEECDMSPEEISVFFYPNAINKIASLSIRHNSKERIITKRNMLEYLNANKNTAISKWTLALRNRKQLLSNRRNQLKHNLDQNSRIRYFLIDCDSMENFSNEVVKFISDYIKKYNSKWAHTEPPLFCFRVKEDELNDIQSRLYEKGIVPTDGCIGGKFFESFFFRKPLVENSKTAANKEFFARILSWDRSGKIINNKKADDLFILGEWFADGIEPTDINVESLGVKTFQEARYLMRMTNVID